MREPEAKILVPASFELPGLDGVIAGATLGEVEELLMGPAVTGT